MTTVLNNLKKLRRNRPRVSGAEQYLVMGLRHAVRSAGVCVLMGLAVAGQSFAQTPSGVAVAVVQSTSAKGPGGLRILLPQKPVFSGDRINTGAVGEAQIRFRDGTRLVVGPNSSLVIDRFVYSEDKTTRKVGINFVKGAFRFISGNSGKQAYALRTPSGTLGVRGTMLNVAAIPSKGSVGPRSIRKSAKLARCEQGKHGCKGSDGELGGLTRKEIARLQNGCSDVFRKPRKYNPNTVAVCSLLASL